MFSEAKSVSKKNIVGEEMLNLCDVMNYININEDINLRNSIITPYYICDEKRYELYQYEFRIEDEKGVSFEEHILRITGVKKLEMIPKDILDIRKMCFAQKGKEDNNAIIQKLINYFRFLRESEVIQREIINVFGEFNQGNLFICVY